MAIEFGPTVRRSVFHWLKKEYRFTRRISVPRGVVGRVDYAFRGTDGRTIGVIGRNLEGPESVAGVGQLAWTTSEEANFELAEGTLDGVILVVLADEDETHAARTDIAAFVATQTPPSLVNDTVIGYRKAKIKLKRFVPTYQERRIF